MTTRDEISDWFDRGIAQKAKFMLVIWDTFDHEDYPSYASSADDCTRKFRSPGEMQRVMEVYDLSAPKDEQMAERRCMRLPVTHGNTEGR